ncbi:MAG: HD domain-containing protein [Nitrosomonadales bacterium]|nr:HD domain-containing protein [Nitrosomonadales bacterium]
MYSEFLYKLLGELKFRIDGDYLRVRAEQLHSRLTVYPAMIFSQMALQPLLVWLLWNEFPHTQLLLWLAAFYVLHSCEIIFWWRYRRITLTVEICRHISTRFTQFALLVGAMWGIASVVFFSPDLIYQILLICVMLGLVAGSANGNPVHPPSLFAFPLMTLTPLIVRIALEGDKIHLILATMLLFFMVIVLDGGRKLGLAVWTSLKQNFENLSLVEQLLQQKEMLSQAQQQLEHANEQLRENAQMLAQKVQERTAELFSKAEELGLVREASILALSSLAETRDNETGNHIRRTQNYIVALAQQLHDHPRFKDFLSENNIDLLFKVAPLHDIGKVGIPDSILLKPGKLTPEEFEIMKTHTTLGASTISAAEAKLGMHNDFLQMARLIAIAHHEKWDGSGYPNGLAGDDIPTEARLMAIADVYDALITQRPYKPAFGHEQAVAIIKEGRGKHFDPDIVDTFLRIQDEFHNIALSYQD